MSGLKSHKALSDDQLSKIKIDAQRLANEKGEEVIARGMDGNVLFVARPQTLNSLLASVRFFAPGLSHGK